jgi:cytochrome P450
MWGMRFDHPEPNFEIWSSCAEFWSTLTTIPVAGFQLLAMGLFFDFPLPIIYMYVHTIVMYCGAFTSHMTLVPNCFSATVTLVIGNSLMAFLMWGSEILPFFNSSKLLHFCIFLVGLAADLGLVFGLPYLLGDYGGFKMLSIAQPPFVLLGWLSAEWIFHFKYPRSGGVHALCIGGRLLISAMVLSSIETFVEPFVLSEAWMHFPVMHVAIHVAEQIGIYYYGVGLAWLHMHHTLAQPNAHFVAHSALFGLPIVITSPLDRAAKLETIDLGKRHETISAAAYAGSELDLLDEDVRRDPFPFYESMLHRDPVPRGIQRVAGERHIYAVYDADTIASILRNDVHFSSNPYRNERFLGLSTSSGDFHQRILKLLSPYYASSHLKSSCSNALASALQSLTDDMMKGGNQDHRCDVYKWANRMAVISGLVALGFSEGITHDLSLVDRLQIGGLDMVKAVAPVGGSGARHGISVRLLFVIIGELLNAVPSVLRCCWRIGIVQSWKLFRPFDSVVLDLLANNGEPRSGMLQYPRSVASAANYFHDLNAIWMRETINVPFDDKQCGGQSSVIQALLLEERNGGLERYQILALIAQLTVGMTVANGLMSAIYHLTTGMESAEMKQILRDPNMLRSFVHEVLRHDAPLQRLPRRVTADVEIEGVKLIRGDSVILFLGMGNVQQGSGTKFDYRAAPASEQPLVETFTFGRGTHRCLGRSLSYLEIEKSLAYIGSVLLDKYDLKSLEYERLADYDVGNYGFTRMTLVLEECRKDRKKSRKN